MYIGKARAYTNIALIKYWGKQDEELIIPMNNSVSLTLDAFYTQTLVIFDETNTCDTFVLNHKKQGENETKKITKFLDIVRKKKNTHLFAKVISQNFVPTAAGLASSASAFAALAAACNEALQLHLTQKELSILARRGSGSACRSIFKGFVEWEKGMGDKTSFAKPIASDNWEEDLAMLFVLVSDHEKEVSSRKGMKRTISTSCFYEGWLKACEEDLHVIKEAIATKDFIKLGEVTERSALRMHATTLGAIPPFTYWNDETLKVMQHVQKARKSGIPCYFTMDAGPNVKILVEKKNLQALTLFLKNDYSENQLIPANAGLGIAILPIEEEEIDD